MANMSAPPEAQLIRDARKAHGVSIRAAARLANMSEGRWRQIEAGYQTVRAGERSSVVAPAATLARMAYVLTVDSAQLREAGRDDAAKELATIKAHIPLEGPSIATRIDHEWQPGEYETVSDAVQRVDTEAMSLAELRSVLRQLGWQPLEIDSPYQPDLLVQRGDQVIAIEIKKARTQGGQDDVTEEPSAKGGKGEAPKGQKTGAGDPRSKLTALPTEFQGEDPELPPIEQLAAESGGQKGIETPPGEEGYSQDPDDHWRK